MSLKLALTEKRISLESGQTELIQYQQRYEESKKELAILEERQNSFQIQKKNLVEDISSFNEELSEINTNKHQFEEEINQRKEELNNAVEKTDQIEIKLAEVSSKRESTQAMLEISRQSRINHETRKVQLSVRIEELENRIASLSMEQEKIKDGIARLEEEKRQVLGKERSIKGNLDETQQRLLVIKEETSHFSGDLVIAFDERKAVELKIAALETKSAKAQAQLEVLKQAEEALSGYSEGSKVIVEGSQKGRLPGGIVPLSQFFTIEEEYEKAISAALGELTDILIVPSRGKDVLIRYLESKDNDRVALIINSDMHKGDQTGQFKNKDGVLGNANEMVKVDAKYQQLIDHLLRDTVIVQDGIAAQKILPTLSGSQKVVTLQGLVFLANGVLISGPSSSGKRISRTRRRHQIQEEFESCEGQKSKLQKKKEEFSNKILELENQFQLVKKRTQSFEEKLKAILIQHQEKKDTLTRLDEQLLWHTSQQAEIDRKKTETETKRGIAVKDLDSCNEEIGVLLIEEKNGIEIVKEHSVFDLQQSLNYWKTHRIVAQNSLDAAQRRFKDHSSRVSDAQQRLGHYQTRLSHIENGIIEIRKNNSLLRKDSNNLEARIEEITANQITPLLGEVNELEEKFTQITSQITDIQKEIIPAERKMNQVQLELMQKKERITSLEERIEADFNLVIDIKERVDPVQSFSVHEKIIHQLPEPDEIPEKIDDDINQQKRRLRGIGAINPDSQQEFVEVKERFEFLDGQITDLQEASKNLQEVIEALDSLMERDFLKTFKAVGEGFKVYFKRLFNGGDAKLLISDEENPVEGGIDLVVRLPGRRQQGLALLSGGERSLTAVALIFALLKVSPTPFCILDEVDAMLDEFNVGRFIELLRELSHNIQFIIITHNRNTVQAADVIYGVTMGRDATSQMISLKLEDVDETFVE